MNFNKIKLHCTDNDKIVEAEIVEQSDTWITAVMKPGDVKVVLKKKHPWADVYIGQLHGYEFVYKLNTSDVR